MPVMGICGIGNSDIAASKEAAKGNCTMIQCLAASHMMKNVDVFNCLNEQGGALDKTVYSRLVQHCGNAKALSNGRLVHNQILASPYSEDRLLGNLLIEMYGKCGSLGDAKVVFDAMQDPNVFTWTIMIAAFSNNQRGSEALQLFRKMELEGGKPNKVTFVNIVTACSSGGTLLAEGKAIHGRIAASGFESDVVVATALVNMYGKHGNLQDARSLFDRMPVRNVVSWNAMITVYQQGEQASEAVDVFRRMELEGVKGDEFTFGSILSACSRIQFLAEGKAIHRRVIAGGHQCNLVVANAIVSMYGCCWQPGSAKSVFDNMQERDVISWNALIASYAQNGHIEEALELYGKMGGEEIEPNEVTYLVLLDACGSAGELATGRLIHATMLADKFEPNHSVAVSNALLDMYSKCGSLDSAASVFSQAAHKNVVSWTCVIAAHAQHGHRPQSLDLYRQMQLEAVAPNGVSYLAILSACAHSGMLDESRCYFMSMIEDYSIAPVAEHYGCLIDLLGRMGKLIEAEDLITSMPYQPHELHWTALLNACRMHGDVSRGADIAGNVSELLPADAMPFVMLSNMFAEAELSKS